MGNTSPRPSTGLGMTWTPTSSPTFRAAAAPASVAAFTEATSPRTIAVTRPASTFCQPTKVTSAVLTMASVASIMPTKPRVSMRPSASPENVLVEGIGREPLYQIGLEGLKGWRAGRRFLRVLAPRGHRPPLHDRLAIGQHQLVRQVRHDARVIGDDANAIADAEGAGRRDARRGV